MHKHILHWSFCVTFDKHTNQYPNHTNFSLKIFWMMQITNGANLQFEASTFNFEVKDWCLNHGMQFRIVLLGTGDTYQSDGIPVHGPSATQRNVLQYLVLLQCYSMRKKYLKSLSTSWCTERYTVLYHTEPIPKHRYGTVRYCIPWS